MCSLAGLGDRGSLPLKRRFRLVEDSLKFGAGAGRDSLNIADKLSGPLIAQKVGELPLLFGLRWKIMPPGGIEQPQATLDRQQRAVRTPEKSPPLFREKARSLKSHKAGEGLGRLQRRIPPAMHQLEHLHD